MEKEYLPNITRDEYTEAIYDKVCFNDPINPMSAEDIAESIKEAINTNQGSLFLSSVAEKLNKLGITCTAEDGELMRAEIVRRYKDILHQDCPKAVTNWFKGVTPGITNRTNNYDLCYALEMNFEETYMFFQKAYLTQPFNCKSRVDAIYFYCFYNNKSYDTVIKLIKDSEGFEVQENVYTASNEILKKIIECSDDEAFLSYLTKHCYSNEQSFQKAREIVNAEIDLIKKRIADMAIEDISLKRLNSQVIEEVLGYRYQSADKDRILKDKLPREFTQSMPNDVTIGQIINGKQISYEVLRKSLILFKFYNFYIDADNEDVNTIAANILDFYDELDGVLLECGFAQLYARHPFDALMLYCANSYDPILTLQFLYEYGRNPDL